jgi:hypothetical protein
LGEVIFGDFGAFALGIILPFMAGFIIFIVIIFRGYFLKRFTFLAIDFG